MLTPRQCTTWYYGTEVLHSNLSVWKNFCKIPCRIVVGIVYDFIRISVGEILVEISEGIPKRNQGKVSDEKLEGIIAAILVRIFKAPLRGLRGFL